MSAARWRWATGQAHTNPPLGYAQVLEREDLNADIEALWLDDARWNGGPRGLEVGAGLGEVALADALLPWNGEIGQHGAGVERV
jgi:hypothetical protein